MHIRTIKYNNFNKKLKFVLLISISFVCLIGLVASIYINIDHTSSNFLIKRVAHAGGKIHGRSYTNSIEALDLNIKKGFEYFEIDLEFTTDGHLVCLHDWNNTFKSTFGLKTEGRVSLKEFEYLIKIKSKYTPCTLESLMTWMDSNKNAVIITDVKYNNLKALEIISKKYRDFEKRIIPQIYVPKNYEKIKKIGYNQIIWTLYRYKGSNKNVLNWVELFKGPFAITMPYNRAKSGLSKDLEKKGIPTYVHTVNNITFFKEFLQKKYFVNEIYTDNLAP